MAQNMMTLIREMVAEGKSRDEIVEYFTERYGEWVLLEPKAQGFNLLVWIIPPIGLLSGLLVLRGKIERLKRDSQPADVSDPEDTKTEDDDYLAAVRREVEG
jgi:cytochrome c-type biogenesis protein CcmH